MEEDVFFQTFETRLRVFSPQPSSPGAHHAQILEPWYVSGPNPRSLTRLGSESSNPGAPQAPYRARCVAGARSVSTLSVAFTSSSGASQLQILEPRRAPSPNSRIRMRSKPESSNPDAPQAQKLEPWRASALNLRTPLANSDLQHQNLEA